MIPTIFCDICGSANRPRATFCATCGKRLQGATTGTTSRTLTGLLTQQHVIKQRYRVLAMVGKGGFGAVYKAADMQFGNRVLAVKEMSQSNLSPQELAEATDAFKREALLLANLTHPNLPRIYEQFSDTGRWYLVMDFIEGETLEETLVKVGGKLPVERVLHIGVQLCSVLDYLHNRLPPIIFRDLKPANVMLAQIARGQGERDGHIYLIDFGIARHFKPGQSKDTAALGSTGYAAPEQYGKAQTTQRADIYSLGATLHEMLSGNDPADSPFHFAPLHLHNTPALASLETLIMQMLEIDASKRPASVASVMQSLQRIAALYSNAQTNPLHTTLPPGYRPSPTMPPIVRTTQPQANTAKPASKRPKVQKPQPSKPVNLLFSCTGHCSRATAVAWSRNGTRIVSGSFDKSVRVWNAANGNLIQTYQGHSDRVQTVAWSPDGTRVASGGDDRTVHIWNASTGGSMLIYGGHTDHVLGLAWSPDGMRIASASADKTVQVWDVATGRNLFTYRGHSDYVFAVAWSPDGKRLATGGNDKVAQVWELAKDTKGNFLTSFLFSNRGSFAYRGHSGCINAIAWSPDGRRIASVGKDKSMQVWDAASGKLTFIYRHRSSAFNAVAWSFDSRRIATGSNDKTVQVWDALTRSTLCIYSGHTGYVNGVAWSPEGTRIASASVDKTVQVWRLV
ncbi:MAG TPA: protein kinase [Ktedonobacteraceae bacterium]|nr:protein kinase [Ktedonobacteraceae bacterium]